MLPYLATVLGQAALVSILFLQCLQVMYIVCISYLSLESSRVQLLIKECSESVI